MATAFLPPYTETLSEAVDAIEKFCVTAKNYVFADREAWLNHWTFCGGIPYETMNSKIFEIRSPKNRAKFLVVNLYRMPSGRYEVNAYVS